MLSLRRRQAKAKEQEYLVNSPLINLTLSKLPAAIPLDAGFSGIHLEFSNFMRKPAYSIMLQVNYRRYWSIPIPDLIPNDLRGRVANLTAVGPFIGIIASRILTPHPLLKPVKVIHWPKKWNGKNYWLYTTPLTIATLMSRVINEAGKMIKGDSGGGVVNLIDGSFTYYAVDAVNDSELLIHITPNEPYAIRRLIEYLRKI